MTAKASVERRPLQMGCGVILRLGRAAGTSISM